MRVVRRRRREHDLEFPRARLHLSLESRRQGSTNHKLALQSWGQAIAFCEPWRKMRVVSAIPVVDIAVTISISFAAVLVAVTMTVVAVIIVIAIMLVVAIPVSVTMALGRGDGRGERQGQNCGGTGPKPDFQ
jgi:hypothetical protein